MSTSGERDSIEVKLKTDGYLLDEDYLTFEEEVTLVKNIPKQFPDPEVKEALESTK